MWYQLTIYTQNTFACVSILRFSDFKMVGVFIFYIYIILYKCVQTMVAIFFLLLVLEHNYYYYYFLRAVHARHNVHTHIYIYTYVLLNTSVYKHDAHAAAIHKIIFIYFIFTGIIRECV